MCYHWGLAVGHKYSHNYAQSCTRNSDKARSTTSENSDSDGESNFGEPNVGGHENAGEQNTSSASKFEGSQDSDDDIDSSKNDTKDPAVVLAMDKMYGDSWDLECYHN